MKTFNGMTVRERLAQHKRNETCANGHSRIDPLGFPLEGFDAVGRARTTYADGKPVDVTGELADDTKIVDTKGLLDYMQNGLDAMLPRPQMSVYIKLYS